MRVTNVVFLLMALDALSAQNVFTSHMADANVTIEERLESPTPRMMDTSSRIGPPEDKSWISGFGRLVKDNAHHDFFGYNVLVDRVGTTGSFRVSFQPVSGGARTMNLPNPSVWAMLPTPNLPADQIVHSGDTTQDWEKYKAEACKAIPDNVRQLECQLKLTLSRIADLNSLY